MQLWVVYKVEQQVVTFVNARRVNYQWSYRYLFISLVIEDEGIVYRVVRQVSYELVVHVSAERLLVWVDTENLICELNIVREANGLLTKSNRCIHVNLQATKRNIDVLLGQSAHRFVVSEGDLCDVIPIIVDYESAPDSKDELAPDHALIVSLHCQVSWCLLQYLGIWNRDCGLTLTFFCGVLSQMERDAVLSQELLFSQLKLGYSSTFVSESRILLKVGSSRINAVVRDHIYE